MSPPSDQPSKLPLPPLVSRPATSADLDLLVGMRRTCGWGELDVPDALAAAAAGAEALFVFELGGEPAGMASIVFEGGKEDLTSRETGRMMISRLYLNPQHQGKAYGNQMVALLEGLCFERYGARAITLDVLAYDPPSALTAQEAVGPSRNSQWYRRLGYVDFKDPAPQYFPSHDTSVVVCFLEKMAPAIAAS